MRTRRKAIDVEEARLGRTTLYDAFLFRDGFDTGDYVGVINRPEAVEGRRWYRDSEDAGTVLQWIHDRLDSFNLSGSKGGIGNVAIQPNKYSISSTVTITERGFGLYGMAKWQQGRGNSGPQFSDGGVGAGNSLIHVKDTKGFSAEGIYLNLGDSSEAYGLHIENSDVIRIKDVNSIDNMDQAARPVRIYGSYEGHIRDCFLHQFEMEEGVKNVNNYKISFCNFTSANPGAPPVTLSAGGNRFVSCVFNQDLAGDRLNDGVPGIANSQNGAGFQRYQFYNCRWIGKDGDPVFENQGRVSLFNCAVGSGRGPVFRTLRGCRLIGCRLNPQRGLLVQSDNTRSMTGLIMHGNYVKASNAEANDAAIDISGTDKNSKFQITNNLFEQSKGTHDLKFSDKNAIGPGAVITNNNFDKGIKFGGFGYGSNQGSQPPKVLNNQNYNPIRASRQTPTIPNGTGSTNKSKNRNPQPAHVYMSGGTEPYDPSIVDHTGSTVDIAGSPKHVKLDRFGGIYFRSSVPGNWTWYWE